MSYLKISFVVLAVGVMSLPSLAEAQQFTQRGTRAGVVAGAIIGGIVGDDNNEAFAGSVIGGLVGGVTGRTIGRSLDNQYAQGFHRGAGQYSYAQPTHIHTHSRSVQYVPVRPVYAPAPVYRGRYYGGGGRYHGGHYRGGRGRGW